MLYWFEDFVFNTTGTEKIVETEKHEAKPEIIV